MFSETTLRKIFVATVILLMLIITTGGVIIWSRYEPGDPVEIIHPTAQIWEGTIYIDGVVNLPGYYPFTHEDTIETLVQAAGGTSDNLSLLNFTLLIDNQKHERQLQKIDINRAEKWLLEALPGIGEVIAQHIIDYRTNHGRFTNTLGLLAVDGIGTSIYERIKEYVTVSD